MNGWVSAAVIRLYWFLLSDLYSKHFGTAMKFFSQLKDYWLTLNMEVTLRIQKRFDHILQQASRVYEK